MTRHEALGWVIIVGVPLMFLIWVISVIPPEVWILLAILAVVLVFAGWRGKQGEALREAWSEGKRKSRVQYLQQEVARLKAKRISLTTSYPGQHKSDLADLDRELALARQELGSLWKPTDGYI